MLIELLRLLVHHVGLDGDRGGLNSIVDYFTGMRIHVIETFDNLSKQLSMRILLKGKRISCLFRLTQSSKSFPIWTGHYFRHCLYNSRLRSGFYISSVAPTKTQLCKCLVFWFNFQLSKSVLFKGKTTVKSAAYLIINGELQALLKLQVSLGDEKRIAKPFK